MDVELNNLKKTFSKKLNYFLKINNISRKDFVSSINRKFTNANFKYTTVTDWVNGNTIPRIDKIEIIAQFFGINKSDLLEENINKNSFPLNNSKNILKNTKKGSDFAKMPILGSIPAGVPFQAIEDIKEFLYIPKERIKGNISDFFLLKIEGDSMSPKYLDGDVLLFNVNPSPNNGAEVAVMVNGDDATFKQIFIKEDGITLHAYNPFYEDRFFSREEIIELPVKVIGQVQSLEYRDLR